MTEAIAKTPAGADAALDPTLSGGATDMPPEMQDMQAMRAVMMDSAELATRAADKAATFAGELRGASKQMLGSYASQRKFAIVMLAVCGSLMLVASGVFGAMAWRLQSRVAALDAMVLAVGKRVVEMDASMESVGAVQDALTAMVAKQDVLAGVQGKIDGRLEEAIKTAQGVPELTARQVDGKTQAMSKQVQSLDARLQAQASTLRTLSGQMQGLQGALGDASSLRREVEIQLRQQRERLAADASAKAAAANSARKSDAMLQYPRPQPADKP
jgi:hypothetical protein